MAKQSKNEINTVVGRNIRRCRNRKNWTIEKLANESQLDNKNIEKIERGEQGLMFFTAFKLADAMDVTINDFTPGLKELLSTNDD